MGEGAMVDNKPGLLPRPTVTSLTPTHIKGLAKGIVATKDWVGDRDQGGTGPLLPRGEVILSIIFCLGRNGVHSERL